MCTIAVTPAAFDVACVCVLLPSRLLRLMLLVRVYYCRHACYVRDALSWALGWWSRETLHHSQGDGWLDRDAILQRVREKRLRPQSSLQTNVMHPSLVNAAHTVLSLSHCRSYSRTACLGPRGTLRGLTRQ